MKTLRCIFLLFLVISSFSCKKKRIANRLEGIWNVDVLTNSSGSYYNVGSYEFKEDGVAIVNMDWKDTVSGIHNKFVTNTMWVNTKHTVTIGNANTGNGESTYKIEELTKTKMKLNSGGFKPVIFEMTKK